MQKQTIETNKIKIFSTIKIILVVLLLSIMIRAFYFEPFFIPSSSMRPGLVEGDRVIVTKYSYGYSKYSMPLQLLPIKNRIFFNKPKRGDVVVFRLPTSNLNYIKRVVGIPGDKIKLEGNKIYVNGIEYKHKFIEKYQKKWMDTQVTNKKVEQNVMQETNMIQKTYNILIDIDKVEEKEIKEYVVPERHYFFMGDNRDYSLDSRYLYDVGYIPEQYLLGKARFILFSTPSLFKKPIGFFKEFQTKRLFMRIL